ncbi:MAG: hypothetical protein KatS3mg129_2248 [Leptospiraceae bacterium]|nr:MAG: hypothetical protein KatS3mg129_2248 [Leptospiraceae bacterium]
MNFSFLNLLGVIISLIFIGWSSWFIYNYFQLSASGRKYKKIQLWISILIFLIGLTDLAKSIKDILSSY